MSLPEKRREKLPLFDQEGRPVCEAWGSYWQITDEMKRREKRGDVIVFWWHAREPLRGRRVIPFVWVRTLQEMKRRAINRVLIITVSIVMIATPIFTMMWQARHVLMSIFGAGLFVASLWWVFRLFRHQPYCVGMHCPGCKLHR